ncbi:1,4-dihydroxy-2-naphthoate octaprenyltransferase [Cellulophaga sp. F20128]|uniref:1,4-dihydroxy-2-naphthoate octaprenyltransferase n=1 Tax=Cellulophaga sp. F20128 TaxID=2926413 RepID=UPI001FF2D0E3|nr:1,4-dihydroxy-2-naphthoate octaprenyltransferase [Cellulophaga sp. F20128]MCK0156636.1 1,4-dihydroxy-2-naphthoate octaprenyltransferase [Cellulophaga sp. F20128]
MKLKAWINAARLRTLPLSISGIIVGFALASRLGFANSCVFILALCTTIALQVTSNFANDYGDGVKGTDNDARIGPKRAYQSGILTRKELKKGIVLSILVCLLLVLLLIFYAFGTNNLLHILLFLSLGVFSIWAAIKYTVGKSAYGYKGLGDIFVFVFFGLISVVGSLFLFTKQLTILAVLPAVTVGLLSVAVLNLNNLRDIESDRSSGKNTIIVKMGFANGKKYHYLLLFFSLVSTLVYTSFNYQNGYSFIWLLAYIPVVLHVKRILKIKNSTSVDPELKVVALSTFLFAIFFYFSFNNFS